MDQQQLAYVQLMYNLAVTSLKAFDFLTFLGATSTSTVSQSTVSQSTVPSGISYYMAMANNYANRLTRVVNGPDPNQLNQNLSEEDQIAQQSMITRLVILITMFFCHSPAVPIKLCIINTAAYSSMNFTSCTLD